jgi:hypothetical protein
MLAPDVVEAGGHAYNALGLLGVTSQCDIGMSGMVLVSKWLAEKCGEVRLSAICCCETLWGRPFCD